MSSLKKLASQTATYGLSSIVGRFLGYLLVPIYTRIFTTGEYGVVTQLYAYVSFFNILFTYGLETAFFRYAVKHKGNPSVYSTILISIIGSSAVFTLMIILFSSPIAAWMNSGEELKTMLPQYIRWFACVLAFDSISKIPFAKLRQENRAKRFVFVQVAGILINIGLNIFFLILCPKLLNGSTGGFISKIYDPSIGVGYIFISNLISSALTLVLLAPELFKITFHFDKQLWKSMMIYALPLMIGGFAGMINETLDRILLPHLVADKSTALQQLGIYGACYKISIIMTLFIQTFRFAADPFFFSQSSNADSGKTYARVLHYFVIVCSFIFLSVMMYIDIAGTYIGEQFRTGLAVVPILLMANLCLGVYYNLSIWYKITAKTHWGAWITIIGAIITVALNFVLIPTMGYMGAAWATLICYASMMIISYFVGQRHYRVEYSLSSFFGYIGLALMLYFISQYFRGSFELSLKSVLAVNTGLLLIFISVVYILEKSKINYLRIPF